MRVRAVVKAKSHIQDWSEQLLSVTLEGSPSILRAMITQTKLSRLGHVAVQVQDVARAVTFYTDLGMEVAWQDSDWAYVKAGDDGLALLGPEYKHAGPHFGFVFHDPHEIQPYYEKLQAQGYTASKILDHRDGTRSFYAKDPDGNLFEFLYEPLGD